MKTIFEKSKIGSKGVEIKKQNVPAYEFSEGYRRKDLDLPEVSEIEVVRHYTGLSRRAFGVDNGFYPLGSCTMKYNPKVNEEVAQMRGFTNIHPLQNEENAQGALKAMHILSEYLCEITGMDDITLQPAAGAHGEYTGLKLISKYHKARGDLKRNKIIVPDSAHGTNPASATLAGFEVINIKSDEEHGVDLEELKKVVGDDTAALMLTNPTTLGLFEKNIVKIAEIVHGAGGKLYYDGANLNAIMGVVRPGDMGFDVIHLNLHKTFSTPHGGGGPGSGPVGCKEEFACFLPGPKVEKYGEEYFLVNLPESMGKVGSFYGNFLVYLKALTYILTLGKEGIPYSAKCAVLNANYLKAKLQDKFDTEKDRHCMHEFVISIKKIKEETGVSAMDIAKAMIDGGVHPPTMYFPLIVDEALMFEPTETETKETLDEAIELLNDLHARAYSDPESLKTAPHNAVIRRPDEVMAARKPVLRYVKP